MLIAGLAIGIGLAVVALQPISGASVLRPRVVAVTPSPNNGANDNQLNGESCPISVRCKAVGTYYLGAANYRSLIESWNGANWTIDVSPNLARVDDLLGVSCVSAGVAAVSLFCEAVGYHTVGGADRPLIERWNGLNWATVPSPNVGGTGTELWGVSCVRTNWCRAVGYRTIGGVQRALIERWNGANWTVAPSPYFGNFTSYLLGVSCTSSNFCRAVGARTVVPGGPTRTLVERWNGVNWMTVLSPNIGANVNQLSGVSCTGPNFCEAVGYEFSGVFDFTLAMTWNGANWLLSASTNPSAIVNHLWGVSCTAPNFCEAVGDFVGGRLYESTLVEVWNGFFWVTDASPNVGAYQNGLQGVSCPSPVDCPAVGQYDNGLVLRTLVETGP